MQREDVTVITERRRGEERDDPELQNEYNLTF
jgi:hypothetical protein